MTTPDASAGLCDGCDTVTAVTASDDGRAQFCRACLPIANGETAPGIPPGRWRQGSHAPRNLWVGGAYPEGVDVGRMDTPELAAYVVDAVNGVRSAHARGQQIADQRDAYAEDVVRLTGERNDAQAEVERLRAALERIAPGAGAGDSGVLGRIATSRDERRVFAAVDRLVDDGRVAGSWVHSVQGTRWTYTTTTEETT
jgi:hypothetical protein